MKLILAAITVLGLTAFAHASSAPAQPLQGIANSNPLQLDSNLTFYGAETYRIESSTPSDTPILLFSGSGFLFGVECSSGAAASLGQAFDSASASGITIATLGKALSPQIQTGLSTTVNASTTVATVPISACSAAGVCGQYIPAGGSSRIHNGLVGIKHGDASTSCLFKAVTDAQIASGLH